jgi:hypothetical protein
VPALGIGGKYVMTKMEERSEQKGLANSLIGILAAAQEDTGDEE